MPPMDLAALKIFLAVAHERSFSRAAAKVHRTQPAVSQAVRRLEVELGEQLFARSSKTGTLTEAGRMLQNYGQRIVRLAEETESAVRDLRDLRRGRVLIGANEAAVHTLLPLIVRFRRQFPEIAIDELVLLVWPSHPLALRQQVTMEEVGAEAIVAHNDPSPARERVLRLFEQHHVALRMVISLPSLDGIKRAVESKLGVAMLPRRCAISEIANRRLVAVPVSGVSRRRQVMVVCRRQHRSHAADAFLSVAQSVNDPKDTKDTKGTKDTK